jgi:hypothetical protein
MVVPRLHSWRGKMKDRSIMWRRTILSGSLFYLSGIAFPVFAGYETYTGFETALLYLNDAGRAGQAWLFILSFIFCILTILSCFSVRRGVAIAGLAVCIAQVLFFIIFLLADRPRFLAAGWLMAFSLLAEMIGTAGRILWISGIGTDLAA